MGSLAHYACYGKEMLCQIHEKMITPESAPRGGKFSSSGSTIVGNNASACSNLYVPCKECSIATGNGS